jgi:uncharacterized protein
VELPRFRYHPDPLGSGAISESDNACECCGEVRGYAYTGPFYAVEEVESLCPWCIASGAAAEKFDGDFTDPDEAPADLPAGIFDEVRRRTPGFGGWQQERWLFHCNDAMAFLRPAGWQELQPYPDAIASLREEEGWDEGYLQALTTDGSPTAYLFECLHCGTHRAYSDSD